MSDYLLTGDDRDLCVKIRDDIRKSVRAYREGLDYLAENFSAEKLLADDTATYEELKQINPTEQSPDPDTYRISNRLIRAFGTLLRVGIMPTDNRDLRPYDPARAQAVLVLTWLLTDIDAYKFPSGKAYGKWGQDDIETIQFCGRYIASCETIDDEDRGGDWMKLAREARQATESEKRLAKEIPLADRVNPGYADEPAAKLPPRQQYVPTENEMKIIKRLASSKILLRGPDACAGIESTKAGKGAMQSLERAGLVHRPNGEKSGYSLTDSGKLIAQ